MSRLLPALLITVAACSSNEQPKKQRPAPLVTTAKVSVEDVPVLVKGPVDRDMLKAYQTLCRTAGLRHIQHQYSAFARKARRRDLSHTDDVLHRGAEPDGRAGIAARLLCRRVHRVYTWQLWSASDPLQFGPLHPELVHGKVLKTQL